MPKNDRINVLFVCMGNICRSPTAEGVFSHLVKAQGFDDVIGVDSAGTIGYHTGEAPDARAQEAARRYGVDISRLRARQFQLVDFDRFRYILAMDEENLHQLELARPETFRGRLQLFCDYAPGRKEREVPDPYFGGAGGFNRVYDLISEASQGLLETIVEAHFSEHDARGSS